MSVACPPLVPASAPLALRASGRGWTLLAPLRCLDFLAIRMLNGGMGTIVQSTPLIRFTRTRAECHGQRTHCRPSMPRSRCARDRPGRSDILVDLMHGAPAAVRGLHLEARGAMLDGRRGTPLAISAPRRHA